jgi:hypothetical protein
MGRVLLIGYDPTTIPGFDPEPIKLAIEIGNARFDELGIEKDMCLVAPDEHAEQLVINALKGDDYAVVVIGGGLRKDEASLPLFEKVVNLVRQHAPNAAIAFNTNPTNSADAARRWL